MPYTVSPRIAGVHPPPISEVRGWLAERPDNGLELIDLCQAVPDYPPAPELTAHLATLLTDPHISKYSPDEGLPDVRQAVCEAYRRSYGAVIGPDSLCLTIGASQAFWLAIVTLCQAGDEVVVQSPYYFDHPMALEMLGLKGVYAPFDESAAGLPSPAVLESLITGKTRAILLVTPSNPTGAITPPEILADLYELARRHNIALILDETYNAFIPGGARPHDLFTRPDWGEHLIQIASFGKTFALTGYRAGMLVASPQFIRHALKAQDTMAVCQPRITQQAVKYGLEHLDGWVAANREMMARRHDLFRAEFLKPGNPFHLAASGAFFAWVRHPFGGTGRTAARRLVDEAAVLCLPGEVFGPGLEGYLRLAFGNIREEQIPEAVRRFRGIRTESALP
ncbi:aminotransferase [Geobacter sp. SVR]|uniref:aminotransferase n=1 Tax=Geobacter sp. SVR TaxID=2495594 RepID=UPI00143F055E|nr:aminotransferase [Geobacter sp. SVR]BCS52273.1 aminotransferase [Geobacter sp. SVR]GCF85066.1 aminotransferase [Geobacter sp. SVR]